MGRSVSLGVITPVRERLFRGCGWCAMAGNEVPCVQWRENGRISGENRVEIAEITS